MSSVCYGLRRVSTSCNKKKMEERVALDKPLRHFFKTNVVCDSSFCLILNALYKDVNSTFKTFYAMLFCFFNDRF